MVDVPIVEKSGMPMLHDWDGGLYVIRIDDRKYTDSDLDRLALEGSIELMKKRGL